MTGSSAKNLAAVGIANARRLDTLTSADTNMANAGRGTGSGPKISDARYIARTETQDETIRSKSSGKPGRLEQAIVAVEQSMAQVFELTSQTRAIAERTLGAVEAPDQDTDSPADHNGYLNVLDLRLAQLRYAINGLRDQIERLDPL